MTYILTRRFWQFPGDGQHRSFAATCKTPFPIFLALRCSADSDSADSMLRLVHRKETCVTSQIYSAPLRASVAKRQRLSTRQSCRKRLKIDKKSVKFCVCFLSMRSLCVVCAYLCSADLRSCAVLLAVLFLIFAVLLVCLENSISVCKKSWNHQQMWNYPNKTRGNK